MIAQEATQHFVYDYHNQTTLHPLGLLAVVVGGLAVLFLNRRHVLLPMLMVAVFIAPAQRLVVFTLDFNLLRLLVLFGLFRVIVRGDYKGFVVKPIDKSMVLFAVAGTVAYVLLRGTFGSFVSRAGWMFDVLGMYFLFRFVVRDFSDVDRFGKWASLLSVVVAAAFLYERSTGRNVFSIFGGVPEFTEVRDGRLRCQGAFAHSILAGTFWASLLPLVTVRWFNPQASRLLVVVGVVCSLAIIVLSASSTPVAAVVAGIFAAFMFVVRRYMALVRWGTVAGLCFLHMVMTAPVWHLISRIDLVGGSTGYHRYSLIDASIYYFWDWWLLGTLTTATWGRQLFDVTNEYIRQGVEGGFAALVLFLWTTWLAFKGCGQLWRVVERDRMRLAFAWALGATLFIHAVSFMATSYFGQITMLWYLTVAMAGSLTPVGLALAPRRTATTDSAAASEPTGGTPLPPRLRGRRIAGARARAGVPPGLGPAGARRAGNADGDANGTRRRPPPRPVMRRLHEQQALRPRQA